MLLEEQQIGHYRLVRLLGSGGMGEVYLAEDATIQRQVAIKVMRAEVNSYPDANTMQDTTRLFRREAKAIATLDHPHILPLYDYGEATINGATIAYLVMPYRPEGSLALWLRQQRSSSPGIPLHIQDVMHLIRQASEALQHAHDHQIIHQDVKPANFLIRQNQENLRRPDLLLADFGIAKFTTATASTSHSIRGTPLYMAPEQLEGFAVHGTDQYALAIMTYELLTGNPPFQGGLGQVMYQHLHVQPSPPSIHNPSLPAGVDTIILQALAKKPEERFHSITAFTRALQQAMEGVDAPTIMSKRAEPTPDLRTIITPSAQHSTVTNNDTIVAASSSSMPVRGYPRGMIILLIALVLVVVVGSVGFALLYGATNKQQITSNMNETSSTDPYTHRGALALNDPLQNNSNVDWMTGTNQNNAACAFVGGVYQSSQPVDGDFHVCFALATHFSNSVYEVQMTIVLGYSGGIIFRGSQANSTFYYFRVGQDGSYDLRAYVDPQVDHSRLLVSGVSPAIHTGYNQPNLIAVAAIGTSLALYANHQLILHINDNTFSQGQIGIVAYNQQGLATVVYNNVKVWTL